MITHAKAKVSTVLPYERSLTKDIMTTITPIINANGNQYTMASEGAPSPKSIDKSTLTIKLEFNYNLIPIYYRQLLAYWPVL